MTTIIAIIAILFLLLFPLLLCAAVRAWNFPLRALTFEALLSRQRDRDGCSRPFSKTLTSKISARSHSTRRPTQSNPIQSPPSALICDDDDGMHASGALLSLTGASSSRPADSLLANGMRPWAMTGRRGERMEWDGMAWAVIGGWGGRWKSVIGSLHEGGRVDDPDDAKPANERPSVRPC